MTQIKKTMWIKRHPIASFFLLLFGLPIFYLCFLGGLNYSGFCIQEKRWLSDDEIITSAVTSRLIVPEIWKTINLPNRVLTTEEEKYYRKQAFDKFTEKHPDCCVVDRHRKIRLYGDMSIRTPPFLSRIFGSNYGTVRVKDLRKDTLKNPEYDGALIYFTNCGQTIEDPNW
jgi:hypothetical protein